MPRAGGIQLLLQPGYFNLTPAGFGADLLEGGDYAQDQSDDHQSDQSEAKVGPEHGENS